MLFETAANIIKMLYINMPLQLLFQKWQNSILQPENYEILRACLKSSGQPTTESKPGKLPDKPGIYSSDLTLIASGFI